MADHMSDPALCKLDRALLLSQKKMQAGLIHLFIHLVIHICWLC